MSKICAYERCAIVRPMSRRRVVVVFYYIYNEDTSKRYSSNYDVNRCPHRFASTWL